MRIVNRKEFLTLKPNTIYSKYESTGILSGLYLKEETCNNDWCYQDLINPPLEDINESIEQLNLYSKAEMDSTLELRGDLNCGGRDGLFDENQLFIVYDEIDINKLIYSLSSVLTR